MYVKSDFVAYFFATVVTVRTTASVCPSDASLAGKRTIAAIVEVCFDMLQLAAAFVQRAAGCSLSITVSM